MPKKIDITNKCALFATAAVVLNWHYTKTSVHEGTTISWNIDGAALISLFCIVALFFLGRRVYRQIRLLLETGTRVSSGIRFIDWGSCAILLLLLIRIGGSYGITNTQGWNVSVGYGYGSDASFLAMILAAATIVAYQIHAGLLAFTERIPNALAR